MFLCDRFRLGLVDLTSDRVLRLSARYFLGNSAKSELPKHPQRQSSHQRNPHPSAAGNEVLSRSTAQMIFSGTLWVGVDLRDRLGDRCLLRTAS